MPPISFDQEYIKKLIKISKNAGDAIMDIYESEFDVNFKSDQSPLTKADIVSNKIISDSLYKLNPKIPILSEESSHISFNERSSWDEYWLIDPLDGTKEFINKNGEFTTNIALIKKNKPIFGIIHVPATKETYWGSKTEGSFYIKGNDQKIKLCVETRMRSKVRIVASRSHPSRMLDILLEEIGEYEIITKGSSLKLCLIAKGEADIYPRLGPTSEWDIAAGQAVLENAGGLMSDLQNKSIVYNKKDIINPYFIAASNNEIKTKIINALNKNEL